MPSALRSTLLFAALCAGATGLHALTARLVEGPAESAYAEVLGAAVEGAQAELERELDLHEEHTSWDDPWEVEDRNLVVRTTRSYAVAKDVAKGQQQMRRYFVELLGEPVQRVRKAPILIYADIPAYNAFGDEHGEYHSSILGSFYANGHPDRPVATYADENRTRLQMTITHSVLHQYIAEQYPGARLPVWANEGLASYFALFWDFPYGVRELEAIKQQNRLIPFSTLFNEGIEAYTDDSHARFIQLGMMFTYLLRFNEDTRRIGDKEPAQPFDEFLAAMLRGEDVETHPFLQFLTENEDSLREGFLACEFE